MSRTFKDKRLPKGVSIYLNDFSEYVAVESGRVAQHENKNIRASRSLEGAVQRYLNKDTTSPLEVI